MEREQAQRSNINFQPARCRLDNSRCHAGKSFLRLLRIYVLLSAQIRERRGKEHEKIKNAGGILDIENEEREV